MKSIKLNKKVGIDGILHLNILVEIIDYASFMMTVEQIESAILQLPPEEFEKLIKWFADLDYQRWDEQLEKDITDGKLEALVQKAIAEFEAGHCREI